MEALLEDDNGIEQEDLPATQVLDNRILKNVVAYVEVRSTNDNRSDAVRRELEQLGAVVAKKFTNDVTHVIFKEGSNRTKSKALKKGIHLVSVLWVDNCKQNQEHVSERMYPAFVPKLKGTPLLMTKLKKAKSMQPRDFEEELASSAERVGRKKKRIDAKNRWLSTDSTPTNSPVPLVLVQDTQPRSPEESFILTPIRLTIPETPPSMREKLKQLKLAKEGGAGSYTADVDSDIEAQEVRLADMQSLQRKLFRSSAFNCDFSSPGTSDTSSVFLSDAPEDRHQKKDTNASDTSVTDDIINIARNINITLNNESERLNSKCFGVDSDENLLNSQEITTVVNGLSKNDTDTKCASTDKSELNTVRFQNDCNVEVDDCKINNCSSQDKKLIKKRPVDAEKNQRRSSRLSVYQAVEELDKSVNETKVDFIYEEEDPIPKSVHAVVTEKVQTLKPQSILNSSQDKRMDPFHSNQDKNTVDGVDVCSVNENISTVKSKKNTKASNKRSLNPGKEVAMKAKPATSRRKSLPAVDIRIKKRSTISDDIETSEEEIHTTQKSKPKKTMKKKLMSLTDLNDQHSILLEPTKCSQVERPLLVENKGKKSRKQANVTEELITENKNASKKNISDKDEKVEGEKITKGRKRKNNANEKTILQSENSRRSRISKENIAKKAKDAFVNDTLAEENGVCPSRKNTQEHDLTTQLNLTRDNTLVCSVRETTLSLSMSTVYTDGNMPSFLLPNNRKSIDEFNSSQPQRNNRKIKTTNRSVLTALQENENCNGNIMTTDRNVNGMKSMKKSLSAGSLKILETSTHRKNVRPSLVMTSLHSYEQDVVISVVKKLGGFVIAENVNETTTHVICGEPRRTLNILQCLSRGIWLVSKEWVLKSLEAECWIYEGEFESYDNFPTCRIARIEREKCTTIYRQSIFAAMGLMYVSGRSSPPRPHLVQLIKLCGGQVTGCLDKANVYVGADYHPGLTCVKTNWLLDCITAHQLLPMDRYFLDRPKRESSPVY